MPPLKVLGMTTIVHVALLAFTDQEKLAVFTLQYEAKEKLMVFSQERSSAVEAPRLLPGYKDSARTDPSWRAARVAFVPPR
jgi:hypothetical protein